MHYIFTPHTSVRELPYNFSSEYHKNVECPAHIHYETELVIVKKGVLHMTVGTVLYEIPENHALLVLPFEPHSFSSMQDNYCHVIVFGQEICREFFDFLSTERPISRIFPVSAERMAETDRILPEGDLCADRLRAGAAVYPLCLDAADGCVFEKQKRLFDDVFIEAMKLLHEDYLSDISLESCARKLGVHPVTLSKKFTECAGIGFTRYVSYLRVCHAVWLLGGGMVKTVSEAAFESGFGSIRSFNRVFFDFVGKTPGDYVKETRKTPAADAP